MELLYEPEASEELELEGLELLEALELLEELELVEELLPPPPVIAARTGCTNKTSDNDNAKIFLMNLPFFLTKYGTD